GRSLPALRPDPAESPPEKEPLVGDELEQLGVEPADENARLALPGPVGAAGPFLDLDAGQFAIVRDHPAPYECGLQPGAGDAMRGCRDRLLEVNRAHCFPTYTSECPPSTLSVTPVVSSLSSRKT